MPKLFDEKRKDTYIRAVSTHYGGVKLELVDDKGVRIISGSLLTITNEGKLLVHGRINKEAAKDAGLCLDTQGRIVVGQ